MTWQRLKRAVTRRIDKLRHRGRVVWCPVCDRRWDRFRDDWNRPDAICWDCGSHERHRALWLVLRQRIGLLTAATSLLHFSPEYGLRRRLDEAASRQGFRYITADLDPAGVDLGLDLVQLDLPTGAVDAVVCSHVLEHVPDDTRAIAELRRVTARGGWCLVMVPLDVELEETYEDPSVTTPEQRVAAFWQADHLRLYGPDIEHRLAAAGFEVEVIRPVRELPAHTVRSARLLESDWAFLCR